MGVTGMGCTCWNALRVMAVLIISTVVLIVINLAATPREERRLLNDLLELSDRNDVCGLLGRIWPVDSVRCDTFERVTPDGYSIFLRRLVRHDVKPSDKKYLLVPGLGDSASTFVVLGRQQSLAGVLLDHNYQVWLFDPRGRAPLKHVNHSEDSAQFWDFSFDEKVDIDLPVAINFTLETDFHSGLTSENQMLEGVVGHSQGALLILAYLSHHPKGSVQSKVKHAYLMAPPLTGWDPKFSVLLEGFLFPYAHHWLPFKNIHSIMLATRKILSRGCLAMPRMCRFITCQLSGCGTQTKLDERKLAPILTFYPSASSLKNIEHLLQCERRSGLVRKFDREDHFVIESYSHIETPVSFYFGASDRLVDKRRYTEGLAMFKPGVVKRYRLFDFGHADFVWGESAADLIYRDLASDGEK